MRDTKDAIWLIIWSTVCLVCAIGALCLFGWCLYGGIIDERAQDMCRNQGGDVVHEEHNQHGDWACHRQGVK